jgi:hypothetical protein
VRGALVSVVVALAGAAGVTASAWALQAAALPPPKPAVLVAADASAWFHDYRLAVDVFHFDHRKLEGACVRGWYGRRGRAKVHSSVLSFTAGPTLRFSARRRVAVVAGRRGSRFPPGRLAADAGCSRALARALATVAQSGGRLTMERSYAANRPAAALELQRGEERLTLYVSPRTDRPLVAFVDRDGRVITARIYLQRATRARLGRFGLLHEVGSEPKR